MGGSPSLNPFIVYVWTGYNDRQTRVDPNQLNNLI